MFQHILFPTDGSPASQVAADACVRFAAQVGARLTILHVEPAEHMVSAEPGYVEQAGEAWHRQRAEQARRCLGPVEALAAAAKVPFNSIVSTAHEPYVAIIDTAHSQGCDLVAMASHGRRGIKAVLIGSQTQKVLTHSALPVLVFR